MPESAFEVFQGRRNARIVRMLEENPHVSAFMQGILETLIDHCEETGIDYRLIKVADPYLTRDGYFTARITT